MPDALHRSPAHSCAPWKSALHPCCLPRPGTPPQEQHVEPWKGQDGGMLIKKELKPENPSEPKQPTSRALVGRVWQEEGLFSAT